MPNLVGIGNSQVPTNAMLGGLAYQDSVGEIVIDKIKAKTSDTAVDIFVYDTRKDSDGGAWRHRTQNTSWYNETLGTQYRGNRREFPAVAVIVSTTTQVTIYDGDDPNLPMWMVFIAGSNGFNNVRLLQYANQNGYHLAALNGILVIGEDTNGDNWGSPIINFISEYIVRMDPHSSEGGVYNGGVAQRNDTVGFNSPGKLIIINSQIHDVAMTVLPNAPIDESTGLPIPTIAVATHGGFSVIKDDGTVIDKGVSSTVTNEVAWYKGQYLLGSGPEYWALYKDLSEESSGYISGTADLYSAGNQASWDKPQPTGQESQVIAVGDLIAGGSTTGYTGQQPGLSLKHPTSNLSNGNSNLLCEIRKDYNTGWMQGDIKGAFLSSTDDTNVTGELIDLTNGEAVTTAPGNFSSISANSLVAGTISSGSLGRYDTGTDASVLVNGKQYLATLTISNYSGSGDLGVAAGAGFDGSFRYSANGTYTTYITYTSGEVQLFYRNTNTATIGFTLKEVDIDHSINKKGLAIHGTITKTPVANGAELIAYSGFSNSNYLQQDINSDLQFGTGDWAFYGWYNDAGGSGARTIFELGRSTSAGDHIGLRNDGTNLELFISDDGFSSQDVAEFSQSALDAWQFACAIRRNNRIELWNNGVLKASKVIEDAAANLGDSETYLRFGNRTYTPQPWDGSLALWRVSKSAPSPEQIKKIYDDEKCLYHENAKCTLYGTSNAITALAYDDTTNVLHVGTSSGRSEFQGLNRINNTTTAVTTAISASNEFVAEQ